VGEAYDLPHLCGIAELLEEFPDRPVLAYLAVVDGDLEQAREGLRYHYSGSWKSAAEWAESWAEDTELGVAQLWPYVNWEAYAVTFSWAGTSTPSKPTAPSTCSGGEPWSPTRRLSLCATSRRRSAGAPRDALGGS
jgi:hypothetical protein